MIRGLIVLMVSIVAASSGAAQDISLQLPIDCTLGKTCYIQQYMDHDSGPKAQDYLCSPRGKNHHTGTDFALHTIAQMHQGVRVLAAAPGVVVRKRDGKPERFYSAANAETVTGRECGNGVVVKHANGWETKYCHMQKGSIAVKKGQQVAAGDALGNVGLSGRTHFPHMHFSVRKNGKHVDPFAPDGNIVCGAPSKKTLWKKTPEFSGGGILNASFSGYEPTDTDIKLGRAAVGHLDVSAEALVLVSYVFGAQQGDRILHDIRGPGDWSNVAEIKIDANLAFKSSYSGQINDARDWTPGRYTGTVRLMRANNVIARKVVHLEIRQSSGTKSRSPVISR